MLTPAQLLTFPWFEGSAHVVTVPQTYRQVPVTVKLYALDHARALTSTATLPVMAVIDPVMTSTGSHSSSVGTASATTRPLATATPRQA